MNDWNELTPPEKDHIVAMLKRKRLLLKHSASGDQKRIALGILKTVIKLDEPELTAQDLFKEIAYFEEYQVRLMEIHKAYIEIPTRIPRAILADFAAGKYDKNPKALTHELRELLFNNK